MTHRLKFSRLCLAGSALSMAMAMGSPALAQVPTVGQVWQADWSLPNAVSSGPAPPLVGDARGDGSGNLDITAALPKGSLSGNMTLAFNAADGSLRSGSHVAATLDCCGAPDSYAWGDFNFSSYNVMVMDDQLTVAHDGFGFMTIAVRTTGNLAHTARIIDPPNAYSDISLENSIYARVVIGGGESATFTETINSDLLGIFDGTFTANKSREVARMLEVIVPWENNLPVNMSFAYQEFMQIAVSGLDAERVEITSDNSFGHTLQMFVDVYDEQGQLLQGVLTSAQGIGYQNVTAVPEPQSWMLMAVGVMGWFGWRRRAASLRAQP